MQKSLLKTSHGLTPLDDCAALLGAVQARLRHSARQALALRTRQNVDPDSAPGVLRQEVLECVDALGQLQLLLAAHAAHDLAQQVRQQVQTKTGDPVGLQAALTLAQAALNTARHELAGMQAEEKQARHLALHDGLTELPNRTYFRQRLDRDLALPLPPSDAPVLAVLYLDLDGLKAINDTHGHAAGDELLRIVAARLVRSIRSSDMVCRLGGDEFACLLGNELSREQLSHLACKLFDAVSAPLKIGELELTVRPSIGVAVCPEDGVTTDALLRRADNAMYRAKRRQMGYAFFEAGSDA